MLVFIWVDYIQSKATPSLEIALLFCLHIATLQRAISIKETLYHRLLFKKTCFVSYASCTALAFFIIREILRLAVFL